jgi:hypothetical protein
MLGIFRRIRQARAVQRELTQVFKDRGHDFTMLNTTVHEALVREAMATGIEATMAHFDTVESICLGRLDPIVEHYRKRNKMWARLPHLSKHVIDEIDAEIRAALSEIGKR